MPWSTALGRRSADGRTRDCQKMMRRPCAYTRQPNTKLCGSISVGTALHGRDPSCKIARSVLRGRSMKWTDCHHVNLPSNPDLNHLSETMSRRIIQGHEEWTGYDQPLYGELHVRGAAQHKRRRLRGSGYYLTAYFVLALQCCTYEQPVAIVLD